MGPCPCGFALVTSRRTRPAARGVRGACRACGHPRLVRTLPPLCSQSCGPRVACPVSWAAPREPGTSFHAEGMRGVAVVTAGSSRLSSASL